MEKMERKYKGWKSAISEMPKYDRHNGYYVEVFYDMELDKVYNRVQVSLGFNSWTEFNDPNVIKIGNFTQKVTKIELVAAIERAIAGNDED